MYTPPTLTEVLRRLIVKVVSRTTLTDLHKGGELAQLLKSFAEEIVGIGQGILSLRSLNVLDKIQNDDDLDLYAAGVLPEGVTRDPGTRASTYIVLSRTTTLGLLSIPAGFVVSRTDGWTYQTTALATIAPGSTESTAIPVVSQQLGAAGNGAIGSITRVVSTSPGGLAVTNPVAIVGGTDKESNDAFKERIRAYARTLGRGCNRSGILARVFEAQTETSRVKFVAAIKTVWPGVIYLYLDDGTGTLDTSYSSSPGETLVASALGGERTFYAQHWPMKNLGQPVVLEDDVVVPATIDRALGQIRLTIPATAGKNYAIGPYEYWGGLVKEAHRLLYGDPADLVTYPSFVGDGLEVLVRGAKGIEISITGTLLVKTGYEWDTVSAAVVTALVAFVNALNISAPLYWDKLQAAGSNTEGVQSFKLTMPVGDLFPGEGEVLRTTPEKVVVS